MAHLRILCHTAFWFQGVPFLPDTPGDPQAEVFVSLTTLYRELEPDVLAVAARLLGVYHLYSMAEEGG